MNKTELVREIAAEVGETQVTVAKIVNEALKAISHSLKKGEPVTLIGFGTFGVKRREARTGRNPQSGKPMLIKASNAPKFSPGKELKEIVN